MSGDKKSKIRYERTIKITLYLLLAIFSLLIVFGCENHWIIELTDHMYPELREPIAVMTHIEADYNQTGTIYTFTPRDSLKDDLTVTAFFDDGTKITLNAEDYTLSGTLDVGTSTITVSYGGKTTAFDVTVTAAPEDSKVITAFTFASPPATGVIDEDAKTISVTVPYGTSVTSLAPAVTHTGANYSPEGAQDFTNPVTYTVTAEDGSAQDYTVTVTVAASNAKAVTAFAFTSPTATGVINESAKTISVTVPYGTNVTSLTPAVTHTGANYSPEGARNFTSPVLYTVTAADGTTQHYTVTITIAASNAKAVTAFAFTSPAVAGVINESAKTISVTVPYGTNVTSLTPAVTHTGASYSPEGARNFTSPVTYTVTAAGGTTQHYTVTVTIAASNAKAVTAFAFTSPTAAGVIDESAKTISVTVPYGTNVTSLTPAVTHTGASYSPEGARNFTSPVVYTVTAADNSTQDYTVTVTIAASNAKAITAFAFPSLAATGVIDESAKTISVTVPYGTSVTSLTPTVTHTGANYSPEGAQDFTSPVTYMVTAADGSTQDYTVTVTIAASNAKAVTAFAFPSLAVTGVIDESAKTISVTVPYGTSVTSLTPTVTHTGASYSPTTARDFTSPVSYTVTAADGTLQSYVVTVTIAEPAPGDTPGNPIPINNANVVQVLQTDINSNLDKHYRLEANIVLPLGYIWMRIGNNANRFTGTFDGGGHTISGLTINSTENYQGMFGSIGSGGEVKNLGLVNVNITGYNYVGGLVGYNYGTVQNTYATGIVSGGNIATGGLVGINVGTVENSYAAVNVNGGSTQTGGLVGLNFDGGIVRNSYATGSVNGGSGSASGLVGVNYSGSTVQTSVALNPVIVKIEGTSNAYGRVTWSSGTTNNNYGRADMVFIDGTTPQADFPSPNKNANGKDGANVSADEPSGGYHSQSFWSALGWDFVNVWEMRPGTGSLPILRNVGGAQNHEVQPPPGQTALLNGVSYPNLQAALDAITTGGDYTINLTGNQSFANVVLDVPGTNITLVADDQPVTIQLAEYGHLFELGDNVTLTLDEGITLNGIPSPTSSGGNEGGALVKVNTGAEFYMLPGSVISENYANGPSGNNNARRGGGVRIDGGTFIMEGGDISNNKALSGGGGVSVADGGTFIMNGGTISNNSTRAVYGNVHGSAVYVENDCTFTMNDGFIFGNIGPSSGYGGGVYVEANGFFEKKGGIITGAVAYNDNGVILAANTCGFAGDAVYHAAAPAKFRTFTAAGSDNMNTSYMGTAGGWDEMDLVFEVRTEEELRRVGSGTGEYADWGLDRHYKLMNDITLTSSWTRILNFNGTFDGNNKTISNMNFNLTYTVTSNGMFGSTTANSVIKNLGLIDVSFINTRSSVGNSSIGGIVGTNRGRVENCFVRGTISGINGYDIGGVVGYNYGIVENCFFEGIVTGNNNTGGVIGQNYGGTVRNVFSTGSVTGNDNTGGVVGNNSSTSGSVQNSFSTASVTGNDNVGGIVGNKSNVNVNNRVNNNVALNMSVDGTGTGIGRIAGAVLGASVSGNYAYADMPLNGIPVTDGAGETTIHGADITAADLWTTLGFTGDWWTGKLPDLADYLD